MLSLKGYYVKAGEFLGPSAELLPCSSLDVGEAAQTLCGAGQFPAEQPGTKDEDFSNLQQKSARKVR